MGEGGISRTGSRHLGSQKDIGHSISGIYSSVPFLKYPSLHWCQVIFSNQKSPYWVPIQDSIILAKTIQKASTLPFLSYSRKEKKSKSRSKKYPLFCVFLSKTNLWKTWKKKITNKLIKLNATQIIER